MVSTPTPVCDFGLPAVDFTLSATDDTLYTLEQCRGVNGLVVMFICNHCPYVKAILERLISEAKALEAFGVRCVAIMSNDVTAYPEDSLTNMKQLASDMALPFPYLYDESQQVATAYGAVCTPDFFGYNKDLLLQYRGRFDASRKVVSNTTSSRDLFTAMVQIATTGRGPEQQIPSIGCSIKWRTA